MKRTGKILCIVMAFTVMFTLFAMPAAAYSGDEVISWEEESIGFSDDTPHKTEELSKERADEAEPVLTGSSSEEDDQPEGSEITTITENTESIPDGSEDISGRADDNVPESEEAEHAAEKREASSEDQEPVNEDIEMSHVLSADEQKSQGDEIVIDVTGQRRNVYINTKKNIKNLRAAVWSAEKDQDDIRWYSMTKSNNEWSTVINLGNLRHSGKVIMHVYSDSGFFDGISFDVTDEDVPKTTAEIASEGVVREFNVFTGADYDSMRIGVWSERGWHDDLKWSDLYKSGDGVWTGNISLNNIKHSGKCFVHVYTGSTFITGLDFNIRSSEMPKKEIVISGTGSKRTVQVNGAAAYTSMRAAVWSEKNGQDDIRWYSMEKDQNGTWSAVINLANLKHSGKADIHVYSGNTFIEGKTFETVDGDIPETTSQMTGQGDTRTFTVTTGADYEKMRAAVWSIKGGSDDLVWFPLSKSSSGVWTGTVYLNNLLSSGDCSIHVYSGNSYVTAYSFFVEADEMPKREGSVSGTGSSRMAKLAGAAKFGGVSVAVWSAAGGQDDCRWYGMKKESDGIWKASLDLSALRHTGKCHAHFYAGSNFVGAADFTVNASDLPANDLQINKGSNSIAMTLTNAGKYNAVKAAVWSAAGGQDDVVWYNMQRDQYGNYNANALFGNIRHAGTCYVHVYADDRPVTASSFSLSDADLFKAKWLRGNDANIDYLQTAINIAKDNSIGYGHTWPRTISCAGLVGLSLTYLGYGDFIKNDPLGWGYIDLGAQYTAELINAVGASWFPGAISTNLGGLMPGDILYRYVSTADNHIGFYLGSGLSVEARGPGGSADADSSGAEVAIYNLFNSPVSWHGFFRIPGNKIHYR